MCVVLSRWILLILIPVWLLGCEVEVSDNPNASGSVPTPDQSAGSPNDSFFDANRIYLSNPITDSVSPADSVDFFFVELPLNTYRSYKIQLSNLTGDVDVELYNAYLNRVSWSDNTGLADELIEYWRDYSDPDNNIVFIKVINRSDNVANYTLEVL